MYCQFVFFGWQTIGGIAPLPPCSYGHVFASPIMSPTPYTVFCLFKSLISRRKKHKRNHKFTNIQVPCFRYRVQLYTFQLSTIQIIYNVYLVIFFIQKINKFPVGYIIICTTLLHHLQLHISVAYRFCQKSSVELIIDDIFWFTVLVLQKYIWTWCYVFISYIVLIRFLKYKICTLQCMLTLNNSNVIDKCRLFSDIIIFVQYMQY